MLHAHRLAGSLQSTNSWDILGCCTRTGLTVSSHGLPEAGLAPCRGVRPSEQTITFSLQSPARKEKELLTNS